MLSEIKFSCPSWFLIFCVALGVLYALVMYYRDNRFDAAPKWSRWLMAFLRTTAITAISSLLLSPIVKIASEDIKQPIVVVAQDISQSIEKGTAADDFSRNKNALSNIVSKLSETYDVKTISIGDQITEGLKDTFDAKTTNLSKALNYIDNNYADQNLGAVIMATDGIYNEGKNPLYTNSNITAPLYIIAQGDTSIRKDVSVKNIYYNKIAYLRDKYVLQVDIQATNASGSNTSLSVTNVTGDTKTKLHHENIKINNNSFFTTKEVVLDASKTGVNKIRVSLSTVSNEISKINNYKDIYVEVLDARQKILVLGEAPHPDMSALKTIISNNKNYETDIKLITDDNINIHVYDLVIFHNLPSQNHNINELISVLNSKKKSRLFILGSQIDHNMFNESQDVLNITSNISNTIDIQASIVESFNTFTVSDELKLKIHKFPPLLAPYGEYTARHGSKVLLKQRVRDISTEAPLLAFGQKGGYNTGVLAGEGLWKWRMFSFLESQNFNLVDDLINKTIQHVSIKEDKRKFRVSSFKTLYKENENIQFTAQLYNENYELINTPDVFMSIRNSQNKEYTFTFSKSNNYYSLNANLLPSGKYSFEATTTFDGKNHIQKGFFTVQNIQLELYDLTARHSLLRSLSNKFGGQIVFPKETETVIDILTGENALKPTVYTNISTESVINYKWIFWSLLLMLCGEWFLRRYMGNY